MVCSLKAAELISRVFATWPPAEVHPEGCSTGVPVFVDADGFPGGEFFDKFQFEGLPGEPLFGLLPAQFPADKILPGIDDLFHFIFDPGQVLGGDPAGKLKIVVKPVFDGGSDGSLGPGEKPGYRLGHHVAHRVADSGKTFICV